MRRAAAGRRSVRTTSCSWPVRKRWSAIVQDPTTGRVVSARHVARCRVDRRRVVRQWRLPRWPRVAARAHAGGARDRAALRAGSARSSVAVVAGGDPTAEGPRARRGRRHAERRRARLPLPGPGDRARRGWSRRSRRCSARSSRWGGGWPPASDPRRRRWSGVALAIVAGGLISLERDELRRTVTRRADGTAARDRGGPRLRRVVHLLRQHDATARSSGRCSRDGSARSPRCCSWSR